MDSIKSGVTFPFNYTSLEATLSNEAYFSTEMPIVIKNQQISSRILSSRKDVLKVDGLVKVLARVSGL